MEICTMLKTGLQILLAVQWVLLSDTDPAPLVYWLRQLLVVAGDASAYANAIARSNGGHAAADAKSIADAEDGGTAVADAFAEAISLDGGKAHSESVADAHASKGAYSEAISEV